MRPALYRIANVPCNGCTACCGPDAPRLLDPAMGDDPALYQTRVVVDSSLPALAVKENGDCIYRGASGCDIWDRRPALCRSFDCRIAYRLLDENERRAAIAEHPTLAAIFDAAAKRL